MGAFEVSDNVPPLTSSNISGTMGNNNWYVSDVTVTLSSTDSGSGIKEIHYRVDGGAEVIVAEQSASFTIVDEGTHTVSYYAVDNVGNAESPMSLTVAIDKSAPAGSISASPSSGLRQDTTLRML